MATEVDIYRLVGEGVGVIDVQSGNLAGKAVAGICVLTLKILSHLDELINPLVWSESGEPTKKI